MTAPRDETTKGFWDRLSRSHVRAAAAAVLGGAAGAAYAHFVGCRTGTCPLTSSVWVATVYGGGVGALIGWPNRRPQRDDHSPAGRG